MIVSFTADVASAKKRQKGRSTSKVIAAQIIVDGASVYKAPSFDAPIISYLQMGKKVTTNGKLYKGIGGFGSFYKIKLGSGKYGFVSDVEINVAGKIGGTGGDGQFGDRDDQSKFEEPPKPIYFTRYWGVSGGTINYTEEIDQKVLQSSVFVLGLKMTGPDIFFEGPPVDFNLQFGLGTPAHHSFAESSAGMFVVIDMQITLPVMGADEFIVFLGGGPMGIYSRYEFNVSGINGAIDAEEIRAGVVGTAGMAMKLGRSFAIRLEGKYYYEQFKYFGGAAALQMRY